MTQNVSNLTRTLVLGAATWLLAEAGETAGNLVRGSIAGKVFDSETKKLLADVTVGVRSLGTNESFEATTDASGRYFLPDTPAAIYTFSLRMGGQEIPLQERMDMRLSMPFILESCFEVNAQKKTASVRNECVSGFVEEARVATIGPHRLLLPENFQEQTAPAGADVPLMPVEIQHTEIECLVHDHFPLVDAGIPPGDKVQTSRVYFRSDKYPDFYYVEMTKDHPTISDFQAILPKPSAETERIIYYIESVDANFDSLQTAEFDPRVLPTDQCTRREPPVWWEGEDASIVIGATQPGASAIPPGFSAVGITGFVNSLGVLSSIGGGAGGAAVGATTATLIVAGGAATVATTVAITNDEASPPR